jgi:REP-associated tyrosine transposase
MRRSPRQLALPAPPTWGGRRDGAGRKPGPGRRRVPHRLRAAHDPRCPVHVTLRARVGLPSLRRHDVFNVVRAGFTKASTDRFRLLHFTVQHDHVHLLLEADEPGGFRRGVQGLAIRIAKAVNRALGRRGTVWADRYHARTLATPREVRHAFVYVLQNWRKHLSGVRGFDPRSSAAWFKGWRISSHSPPGRAPVAAAQTWLASVGWRRHGLVGLDEAPRVPSHRRLRR